jgi:hypothetical protein
MKNLHRFLIICIAFLLLHSCSSMHSPTFGNLTRDDIPKDVSDELYKGLYLIFSADPYERIDGFMKLQHLVNRRKVNEGEKKLLIPYAIQYIDDEHGRGMEAATLLYSIGENALPPLNELMGRRDTNGNKEIRGDLRYRIYRVIKLINEKIERRRKASKP